MKSKKRSPAAIDLFGPFPDPVGGVATHVSRLAGFLRKEGFRVRGLDTSKVPGVPEGTNVRVHSLRGLRMRVLKGGVPAGFGAAMDLAEALWRLTFSRADLAHFHTSGYERFWREWLYVFAARLTGKKTAVSIHGGESPEKILKAGPLERFFARRWLLGMSAVAVMNPNHMEFFDRFMGGRAKSRVRLIPPFLPPDSTRVKKGPSDPGAFVLMSMGNWYRLYGFDQTLKAAEALKRKGRNVRVVLRAYIYDRPDAECRREIFGLIDALGMRESVEVIENANAPLDEIYLSADVYVRPSRSDSYGIALAEALHFGVPAVASDVCERAPGVLTHPTDDLDGLVRLLEDVLDRYEFHLERVRALPDLDYRPALLDFYRLALSG